jgi:hypothetical protein
VSRKTDCHVAEDRPLIVAAEERAREIAYRCSTVERACRAIGFSAKSGYERVAALVARVAGESTLRRTVAEIAEDRGVAISRRHVARAIEELSKFGVIVATEERTPPTQRRGRPEKTWLLQVNWETVRKTIADAAAWEEKNRQEVIENDAAEYSASRGHHADICSASGGHLLGISWASGGHFENHTLSPSLNPNTLGPSSLPSELDLEGMDQKCASESRQQTVVDREATEATARRLCAALRWPRGNVRTLWQVAAAFDVGLVSEFAIADACRASVLMSKTDCVGYFRTVLAERCETDAQGLSRLLRCVVMVGGWPESPPAKSSAKAVALQRVPSETIRHPNDVRNELLNQLEAIA